MTSNWTSMKHGQPHEPGEYLVRAYSVMGGNRYHTVLRATTGGFPYNPHSVITHYQRIEDPAPDYDGLLADLQRATQIEWRLVDGVIMSACQRHTITLADGIGVTTLGPESGSHGTLATRIYPILRKFKEQL